MKKNQKGMSLLSALIVLIVIVAGAITAGYGWYLNLVKLFHITNAADHVGELVTRIIGIVPVIGAVVGYF